MKTGTETAACLDEMKELLLKRLVERLDAVRSSAAALGADAEHQIESLIKLWDASISLGITSHLKDVLAEVAENVRALERTIRTE